MGVGQPVPYVLLMFDFLQLMQAIDCKSKYTCMEGQKMVVGYPHLLAVLEAAAQLPLLVVVQIFGEAEMRCQLSQPMSPD
jgi:hypothetical protein